MANIAVATTSAYALSDKCMAALARHRGIGEHAAHDVDVALPLKHGVGAQDQSVRHHLHGYRFDVVWSDELSAAQSRGDPRRAKKRERPAR
jgi:hypothetical protein